MDAFTSLKNYYEQYDEDTRLTSRHGMVEYRTTMRYIERYPTPARAFWKSARALAGTAMRWPGRAMRWMPWS